MAKSVIINGVTYNDVPQVDIPLSSGQGDAAFYETSENDVAAADVKAGKKFTGAAGAGTGTMPVYSGGTDSGVIATKDGAVSIAEGYHDGNGSVELDATEKAKLITGNIKNGVTLFGVPGKSTVVDTEISADAAGAAQILSGKKAFVNGSPVTGTLTAAVVTQDQTTKVLTIE